MPPPYIAQVSLVGMELQNALALIQQPLVAQTSDVLRAFEAVPGLIAPGDAAKIRDLLQAGDSQAAFQRLASYQDVLQLAHEECVVGMPAAANLTLARIAALFGIPPDEFVDRSYHPLARLRQPSDAPPLAAGEASRMDIEFFPGPVTCSYALPKINHGGHCLAVRLGREGGAADVLLRDANVSVDHAEIKFLNGEYRIEDKESTNGTYVNDRRISPYGRVLLKDGDRLRIGRHEMTVRLPYERRLSALAKRLKDMPSYRAIFSVLEQEGFGDVVPKIKAILALPIPVDERLELLRDEVPYDGGLLLKLESFLLRGEVVRLRSTYFPHLTPEKVLETGERLAASLRQADSFADLAERLRRTDPERFRDWIEKLETLASRAGGQASLDDFPNVFGLREQVTELYLAGLSLSDEQRQDLRWRGVTPDLLAERPWRGIQVSLPLEAALGRFRRAIGKRLNLDSMEETIRTSFGDEQDTPSQKMAAPDSDSGLGLATHMVLYKEYQAKSPTSSLVGTGVLTESQTDSKTPEFFQNVWKRLYDDGIFAQPDGYWFFGGTVGAAERFEGRIYLSLRRSRAEEIFRYFSREIEPAIHAEGGLIQYKIAGNPEGYSRADSGVIYFYAKNQKAIYQAVKEMGRVHPEFFKAGHPLFTMPLKDEAGRGLTGLSFGEHPKNSGVSFGSLRTDAMTTAVRTARALMNGSEPPDWNEIRQICAYFLKRAGVDVENPSFNDGGREKFGPLLDLCDQKEVAPSPQPEPIQVPAPAKLQTPQDLIAFEISERYPVLAAEHQRDWTQRMAADILKAWEKSDRGPGSGPNAPTAVPEEIFDARMSLLFAFVSRNPSQTQLLTEILASDQGPRLVRAVAARLKESFPSLKEPGMENIIRTFAENVHGAWKAQSPKAGETANLFEGIYRGRLKWMRDHLEAQEGALSEPLGRLLSELRRILAVQ